MKLIPLAGTFLCLLALSCQNQREKAMSVQDLSLNAIDTAVNAIPPGLGEEANKAGEKFIRTADIRFKVRDVQASTYHIEEIVSRYNGYVAFTNLSSQVESTEKVAVSRDSSLENTKYTVSNMITIRVPNTKLDTTLKAIAHDVEFLDHRTIKADDVSIQYLANQLGKQRYEGVKTNMKSTAKQKDINETQDLTIYRKEMADEYFIANKYLDRDINYSVVNIEIYQRPTLRREIVANDENIEAYTPGLLTRIGDAMVTGWRVLEDILLVIVRLWAVIGLVVIGYFLLRKRIRTRGVMQV